MNDLEGDRTWLIIGLCMAVNMGLCLLGIWKVFELIAP